MAGYGFTPWPKRNPAPFEEAQRRLASAKKRLTAQFVADIEMDDDSFVTANEWASAVERALAEPEQNWTDEIADAAENLIDWLEEVPPSSRSGKPRDEAAVDALRAVREIGLAEHPRDVGRHRIRKRVPKFVLFEEEDRALATAHAIHEEAQRANLQPALRNLLRSLF
jgi:hypothetical protein